MKAIATCFIWIFGCGIALADGPPDPKIEGSHSHLLNYSLVFEAGKGDKKAHFVATLTNVSDQKLKVMVNDKEFHATLHISSHGGQPYEAYDAKYRGLLLTSVWSAPVIKLEPKKSITWVVPLSILRTLHDKEVTHESLQGCTLFSEMNMAVVPSDGSYIANNARQKSNPLVISDKE